MSATFAHQLLAEPIAAAHPYMGRLLGGRYRILEAIGEGGMGTVFLAEQVKLRRNVAVKVLSTSLAANEACLERFRREADAMSRLQHPHIVSLLDYDVAEDGAPYLVMELLVGETLAQRLDRDGALDPREAVQIVAQMADALAAAHDAGIVHRDLKPENVFLVRDRRGRETVKLLDFGISKQLAAGGPRITMHNTLLGSPHYMAPEQILDDDAKVGCHTDQYALGAIAFELLSGNPPFEGDTVWQVLTAALDREPPSLALCGVPLEVDQVVRRALSKNPADRFADVNEFADALAAAVGASLPPRSDQPPTLRSAPPPAVSGTVPQSDPGVATADVAHEMVSAMDEAKRALAEGNIVVAWAHAERAAALAKGTDDPAAKALLRVSDDLLDRVYTARLGGLDARLSVLRVPTQRDTTVSPQVAYLVSRIDGGLSVGEVLDVSPMSRFETLRALTRMVADGILATAAA